MFFKTGSLIAFESNREYIAEVLCINKEEPTSSCNGKCHLAEMMGKESDSDPLSPHIPASLEIEFLLDVFDESPLTSPALTETNNTDGTLYLRTFREDPFQELHTPPPQA